MVKNWYIIRIYFPNKTSCIKYKKKIGVKNG